MAKPSANAEKVERKISKRGGARPNSGGKRPGSGRKPGTRNKRTEEMIAKVEATGLTPLDIMLQAMREAHERGGAEAAFPFAKDAAPYLHAKLSAIDATLNATVQNNVINARPEMTDEQWAEQHASDLVAATGAATRPD